MRISVFGLDLIHKQGTQKCWHIGFQFQGIDSEDGSAGRISIA